MTETNAGDDILVIETPENIFLEFELAGLGSRFLAYLIDTVMQGLIAMIAVYALVLGFGFFGSVFHLEALSESVRNALLIIAVFVLYEGYFIYFETIWRGQSIGKKIMRLRVVRERGFPVTFIDSAIRNLFRVVDAMPPLVLFPSYGLGSAVLLANRQHRRIGDWVAGTLVIRERPVSGFEQMTTVTAEPDRLPPIVGHGRVTPDEYRVLREFFFRKNHFTPERRAELAKPLAGFFRNKLGLPGSPESDIQFLDSLMLLLEHKRQ